MRRISSFIQLEEQPNENLVTLQLPGREGLQGVFERKKANWWQVRLRRPEKIKLLDGLGELQIKFISGHRLYWGMSRVLAVDDRKGHVVLDDPEGLESRATRRYLRVDTELAGSVILTSRQGGKSYVYRSNCLIRNLSLGGALLASRECFSDDINDAILLTCFDAGDVFNRSAQVSFGCTITRRSTTQSDDGYRYCYGLKFKGMFPQFRDALGHFLLEHS